MTATLDLDRLRSDTPGCASRIHFNNAGAALMPRPVLDAMTEHLELVHAPERPEGGVDVHAMAKSMEERRPRLVAVTHVPTNSGLVQPVAEIGRHCRRLDLPYLVDACQSVGQYRVDAGEIGCDFL